ncbi:MAG: helix-turn-helix domain-containing protein [Pseudomonadota bacterium]
MNQTQEIETQESKPAEQVMQPVGEQLREAREARGLSLREISKTTRHSLELLEALETMETNHISPSLLRMQAKSYADFLGLPGDEVAAAFSQTRSTPVVEKMPALQGNGRSYGASRLILPALGVAMAALIGGAVFLSLQERGANTVEAPIASKLSTASSLRAQASALPTAVQGPELALHALRPAWVEVRGSDGTIFRNRKMFAGEIYYPRMGAGWTITVQDAGAFFWTLDEHPVGPVGEDGETLYSQSVDAATQAGLSELSKALAEAGSGRQN